MLTLCVVLGGSKMAAAAAGLVTYACPHFGSWLADVGWNLRYVGAAPAAVVSHLKPGRHLEVTSPNHPPSVAQRSVQC